jgi:hypothetical protein
MSELSPESSRFLALARAGENPPRGARAAGKQRLALALGVATAGTALGTAGAAAAPAASLLTLKSAVVYFAVGVASGSLVSGASFAVSNLSRADVAQHQPTRGPSERAVNGDATTSRVAVASVTESAAAAFEESMNPMPNLPRSAVAVSGSGMGSRPPMVDAGAPRALPLDDTTSALPSRSGTGEMSGLIAAQQALRSGDANLALARLDEHARLFPQSQFEEERSAARIVALCTLGRFAEGRALLTAFTQRFPASPATRRVLSACR